MKHKEIALLHLWIMTPRHPYIGSQWHFLCCCYCRFLPLFVVFLRWYFWDLFGYNRHIFWGSVLKEGEAVDILRSRVLCGPSAHASGPPCRLTIEFVIAIPKRNPAPMALCFVSLRYADNADKVALPRAALWTSWISRWKRFSLSARPNLWQDVVRTSENQSVFRLWKRRDRDYNLKAATLRVSSFRFMLLLQCW